MDQNANGLGQSQFQSFGPRPPPPPSAIARVMGLLRSFSVGAFGLLALVLVLETFGPKGHRPSDMIGAFHGRTTQVTLDAERKAQVETAGEIANAQQKAQAKWAMETEVLRQQEQAALDSLAGKEQAANAADLACISGPFATAIFGDDASQYAGIARGACGLADQLRQQIAEAQAEAARIGSAIMDRGATDAAPQ